MNIKTTFSPLLLIVLCLTFFGAGAQVRDTSRNTDPSLRGQYNFMLSKSRNMNGYRLINPNRLSGLWKNVNDSLRAERSQLAKARTKIKEQAATIASLNKDISGKESSLNEATTRVDEIRFLGIPFNKGTYSTLVWSIIIVLGAALAFIIFRSASYRKEARYRVQLFQEVSEEYQQYKIKANEKEKKLARELQDERNKMDDLRGR
ncbi:hypothetical protein [Pedobacter sp. SYP-B3415]|uniref:hypothetical protein n=1 Tax=Pedobacter sp. SYP-B3415 TaxID=2496641 RepID=UPI00101C64D7|nr:hypothetical protein [Pedobacter sp. SYP-B3415]